MMTIYALSGGFIGGERGCLFATERDLLLGLKLAIREGVDAIGNTGISICDSEAADALRSAWDANDIHGLLSAWSRFVAPLASEEEDGWNEFIISAETIPIAGCPVFDVAPEYPLS
jgi:hypothetical protein